MAEQTLPEFVLVDSLRPGLANLNLVLKVVEAKEVLNKKHPDGSSTTCLLYTSPSPRDKRQSRMPSSA